MPIVIPRGVLALAAGLVVLGIAALLSLPATAILELADFTLGPGYILALAIEVLLAGRYIMLLGRRRSGSVPTEVILPPGAVPQLVADRRGDVDEQ